MKQVLIQSGKINVVEVPSPMAEDGRILVRVMHSCISAGTEMASLQSSAVPLWKRALQKPDKILWVLNQFRTSGLASTRQLVKDKISTSQTLGYSAAGEVLSVGHGIEGIFPGDLVACAGGQCAFHAEIISVPQNLAVLIPSSVDTSSASTVALGAIAMQGVRRANPTLGECFAVIGLGILGQITIQLLKANGCKVIGMDLDGDRLRLATELGADGVVDPTQAPPVEKMARLTAGFGVDGVIITAATASSDLISAAFQMCRKKARVILVGDVGLNLKRQDIFAKELDFLISSSYGPGRYDAPYEESGLDYPISYVRWTENRNMSAYLELLNEGRVKIEPLLTGVYPIEEAAAAYQALADPERKTLINLFSYSSKKEPSQLMSMATTRPPKTGRIKVGLVGAGAFLKSVHLPNLRSLADQYSISAVISHSGPNAADTAKQADASIAATDFSQVVKNPDIDAFVITTRHHLHAHQTLEALQQGKHVLCEKPLALSPKDLSEIMDFYREAHPTPAPILLTGFNRRFSPHAIKAADLLSNRISPVIINYRMCGGYTPPEHWIHGPEGGGRNLAEACHIYDLFTFFTGARVKKVNAISIRPNDRFYSPQDNFSASVLFEDGSLATLTYTVMGSKELPKEHCEIFFDGQTIVIDDYISFICTGKKEGASKLPVQDKGHLQELKAFANCISHGGEWPIPLWQQAQAMEIAFQVEAQLGPMESRG